MLFTIFFQILKIVLVGQKGLFVQWKVSRKNVKGI